MRVGILINFKSRLLQAQGFTMGNSMYQMQGDLIERIFAFWVIIDDRQFYFIIE
jgi:hypothetical protein